MHFIGGKTTMCTTPYVGMGLYMFMQPIYGELG